MLFAIGTRVHAVVTHLIGGVPTPTDYGEGTVIDHATAVGSDGTKVPNCVVRLDSGETRWLCMEWLTKA